MRKQAPTLTEAELRIMRILWEKGSATVRDVVDALKPSESLAYNTVLTTLGILERKGYVRHTKEGRAFTYLPVVGQSEAQRSVVKFILSRFFDDSPELLVQNLLEHEDVSPEDLTRIKRELKARK